MIAARTGRPDRETLGLENLGHAALPDAPHQRPVTKALTFMQCAGQPGTVHPRRAGFSDMLQTLATRQTRQQPTQARRDTWLLLIQGQQARRAASLDQDPAADRARDRAPAIAPRMFSRQMCSSSQPPRPAGHYRPHLQARRQSPPQTTVRTENARFREAFSIRRTAI